MYSEETLHQDHQRQEELQEVLALSLHQEVALQQEELAEVEHPQEEATEVVLLQEVQQEAALLQEAQVVRVEVALVEVAQVEVALITEGVDQVEVVLLQGHQLLDHLHQVDHQVADHLRVDLLQEEEAEDKKYWLAR